jgi:glycosyltransferase involved in cell wall biosynthesis
MPRISVLTPCYNEVENVEPLYRAVREQIEALPGYDYEHVFIDNASHDGTVDVLRRLAREDPRVKVIVNARNFGHVRSPHHGLLQCTGEAVIGIVADFQDPPELIPQLLAQWEQGHKVVMAVKAASRESALMFGIRRLYYRIVTRLADVRLVENFTGFGLYDRSIVEILRGIPDPYPYFRGLLCELTDDWAEVSYVQPRRARGKTKNNFYSLYDMAMLGVTNHSKVPLRLATFAGFGFATVSFLVGCGYLVYKLVFWQRFSVGVAPLVIGLFFFASVQLLFVGILGEYVGAIFTQVQRRPLVIEKERINFD